MPVTTSTIRKRSYHRRASQLKPLPDALKKQVEELLPKISMQAIHRKLKVSLRQVRIIRDEMYSRKKKPDMTPAPKAKVTQAIVCAPNKDDKRHAAEMYVLSRVGKCTDDFAEIERSMYSYFDRQADYGHREAKPFYLGAFVPRNERN